VTRVTVNPGVCGMVCKIDISKIDRQQVSLKIETKCEKIREMCEQAAIMKLRDVLKLPVESIVYEYASKCRIHTACPVPVAVIKAIEVETGMALPRPVSIEFDPITK
jgi:hypothetical protein